MEKLLLILPEKPQPLMVRYGLSGLIMIASALVQLAVYRYSGFTGLFLLLPGIFASGLAFDRGSGFFATLIGSATAAYLFLFDSPQQRHVLLPLSLFIITGLTLAAVGEALRNALERVVTAEKTKDLLFRELSHRTKNDLMGMSALLRFQAKSSRSAETQTALEAAAGRLMVMASVQDHLRNVSGDAVDMSVYLGELCRRLDEGLGDLRPVKIELSAAPVELPTRKAGPLGLIVNELVTNSFKHAFPNDRPGKIIVGLQVAEDIVLTVTDDGVGCSEDAPEGLGSRLLRSMAHQIGGTLVREARVPGCAVIVRIPLN
jgi:two-component system, sensor histidine kinase PdtaS